MTDDIQVHEGYVAAMKELHPNVTCVPAYYKYATDTFMPMVESGNCPTIFETWFTEPQKLIKAGAIADITDELEARGWLDKMNPSIKSLLSDSNGRVYGIPRDGYALGLMLNVEVFEEAGLVDADGYPIYPKTWDELAETAKTIKEKTDLLAYVSLPRIMPVDGIFPTSHGTSVRPYVLRMMTELLLLIWIPMKQSQQWNM